MAVNPNGALAVLIYGLLVPSYSLGQPPHRCFVGKYRWLITAIRAQPDFLANWTDLHLP